MFDCFFFSYVKLDAVCAWCNKNEFYRLDFIDKSIGSFCTYRLILDVDCGDIVAVVELVGGGGGVIIHTPYL